MKVILRTPIKNIFLFKRKKQQKNKANTQKEWPDNKKPFFNEEGEEEKEKKRQLEKTRYEIFKTQ